MAEKRMYVKTDVKNNNNKFWEISIDDSGHVVSRNGRVGSSGQTNDLGHGQALFDSKIREKERKEYRLVPTVGAPAGGPSNAASEMVKVAASEQIANGCPIVGRLVQRLAEANRHQLLVASGGQLDLNLSTGIVSTPVGVITMNSIDKARLFLPQMESFIQTHDLDNNKFIDILNDYLMLVPQKVAAQRGWHHKFLPDMISLTRQNALLDQLEASIEMAQKEVETKRKAALGEVPKMFDIKMSVLEDPAIIKRISEYYKSNVNRSHQCSHLKPSKFYEVSLGGMQEGWEKDGKQMSNHKQLWHGTRTHNLLSILKGGLIVPKSGGSIQVTGRMFGDGVYFSDQSSKALNYAYGYWDRGSKDDNCFMFLADVAMGKEYTPTGPTGNRPLPKGYDSCFAVGGKSGVQNNEMIVYRTGQANLRYLIEFAA